MEGFYSWWIKKLLRKSWWLIVIFCIAWAASTFVTLDVIYPTLDIWRDPFWAILLLFASFAMMAMALMVAGVLMFIATSSIRSYFKYQKEQYKTEVK